MARLDYERADDRRQILRDLRDGVVDEEEAIQELIASGECAADAARLVKRVNEHVAPQSQPDPQKAELPPVNPSTWIGKIYASVNGHPLRGRWWEATAAPGNDEVEEWPSRREWLGSTHDPDCRSRSLTPREAVHMVRYWALKKRYQALGGRADEDRKALVSWYAALKVKECQPAKPTRGWHLPQEGA